MKEGTYCHSCLMRFEKDPGVREHDNYCSLCFKNGKLCYEGNDLREFKRMCYKSMLGRGTPTLLAKFYTFMVQFAPRWKQ